MLVKVRGLGLEVEVHRWSVYLRLGGAVELFACPALGVVYDLGRPRG